MFGKLKSLFGGGSGGDAGPFAGPTMPAVEYNGYRIRPAPYREAGQYQTAGIIEKDFPDGVKEHRFIRADRYPDKDIAADFAVSKAKQIIDEQGDRIFNAPRG
jgi:hypothetical protein